MKRGLIITGIILSSVSLIVCSILISLAIRSKSKFCAHSHFDRHVIAASCTQSGKTVYTCQRCGYSYDADPTPPTDHKLKSVEVAPTCSSSGYTLYYCDCSYSFRSELIPSSEHKLTKQTFSATCTEQGYTSYSCENCDYHYESDFNEPLGHSFTGQVVRPTAVSAGYTHYSCKCSYSYNGDHVYYSDILESAYTDNVDVLARGIDVSRWNHQINAANGEYIPLNWKAIKAHGIDFVILKAGSTKSGIEPTFEMDYAGARAAGLEVGAYFYTYSTTVSGISKDADMLLLWLEGKKFEYPIYLDLEDPSLVSLGKNHLSSMCETFLCKLQQNGYYAGLYTNHMWLTTILDTARMVTLFDLWYARYPGTSVPTWNEEKYGKQLGMWQYTESGSIDGIDGNFDFNYCYKYYGALMKKWGLNGF